MFVNFHLPLKRKHHICLRFGKQLKLKKEDGLTQKTSMTQYFNIDRYERQKYGLISKYIILFDTNTTYHQHLSKRLEKTVNKMNKKLPQIGRSM